MKLFSSYLYCLYVAIISVLEFTFKVPQEEAFVSTLSVATRKCRQVTKWMLRTDRRTVRQTNGHTDRWSHRPMVTQTDGQSNRPIVRQKERQTESDRLMDEESNGQIDRHSLIDRQTVR